MAVTSQTPTLPRWLHGRAIALGRRPGTELVFAGLAASILGLVVFAPYIHAGGFSYDDWQESAIMRFRGFGGLFHFVLEITPRRPLAALYFAVVHGVLGTHEHWHLALVAGLHITVGLLLFALLREFRLDRASAGAAAVLALLFPYSDSTWLWASAGQLDLCVACWLLGTILALRGLSSRFNGWRWHGAALVLYASSILLYEETLVVVLLTGALYLLRAPRHLALRRWAADVGTTALCLLLFTSQLVKLGGGGVQMVLGVRATLHHMKTIADQGLTVAVASLVPFGSPGRWAVTAAVMVLVASAGFVVRRTTDAAVRRELIRWLLVASAGAVVSIAGWAMLSAADPYYTPQLAGVGNRINVLAGIGLPVLTVGLLGLVATLAFAAVPRERRWAGALLILLTGTAIAGVYLDRLGADRGAWVRPPGTGRRPGAAAQDDLATTGGVDGDRTWFRALQRPRGPGVRRELGPRRRRQAALARFVAAGLASAPGQLDVRQRRNVGDRSWQPQPTGQLRPHLPRRRGDRHGVAHRLGQSVPGAGTRRLSRRPPNPSDSLDPSVHPAGPFTARIKDE